MICVNKVMGERDTTIKNDLNVWSQEMCVIVRVSKFYIQFVEYPHPFALD